MLTVNTHEAKTNLSNILSRIEKNGENVLICRNGHPVAELLPWKKHKNPLKQNNILKKITFNQDPSLPLDEDEWPRESR